MKLINAAVKNFGSYKFLGFDFENTALTLIHGATGSGKSTIMDIAPWILYGVTAKNGNVDEIRSWTAVNEDTVGLLKVEMPDGQQLQITRIRGDKNNDLFWYEQGEEDRKIRGKDISDTQKLLVSRLGVSADTYLASSYFHEFSKNGTFFSATAKDRRVVFEGIANLSFPTRLVSRLGEDRKRLAGEIRKSQTAVDTCTGRVQTLGKAFESFSEEGKDWDDQASILAVKAEEEKKQYEKKHQEWQEKKEAQLEALLLEIEGLSNKIVLKDTLEQTLSSNKKEVSALKQAKCPTCKGPKPSTDLDRLFNEQQELIKTIYDNQRNCDKLDALLAKFKALEDTADPVSAKIEALNSYQTNTTNPFTAQINRMAEELEGAKAELLKAQNDLALQEAAHVSNLTLSDLCGNLRGELLRKSVTDIQESTNKYLETYFDAELRVEFELDGADSLSVGIRKNGYECVYRQLSRGQRAILRLCFVLSVMSASANKSGFHAEQLFLDEVLDGCDADLKVKAFSILQELSLSHSSVFVVDHSLDFKSLFDRKCLVQMINDESEVVYEES